MNPHERFLACMRFEPVDRVPLWEWGPWTSTLRRWQQETLGEGRLPPQFVECDPRELCGVDMWMLPRYEQVVVAEDEETITVVSDRGVLTRTFKNLDITSMPDYLEYPIKTPDDWEALKNRYDPAAPARFPEDWPERCARWRREGAVVEIKGSRSPSLFGFVRELLGPERVLYAFHDQPAMIHDMMEFNTEFLLDLWPRLLDEAPVTTVMIWEDMCYRNGPLISPAMFREFMLPRYKRLTGFLRSRGVDRIYVDCDGNIEELIPLWLEAGIEGMFPMEVAAGMDVNKTRREYGRDLFMIGGIDKRVLARDRDAIDRELERTLPLAEAGGYIPMLDHGIPHDVPYENFVYYWQRKKEMLSC